MTSYYKFYKLEEEPGFLLWQASILWRKTIENDLKPLNLTYPQFVVLTSIDSLIYSKDNNTQARIGKLSGIDPNTISQILRGLQKKNLIMRLRSNDERSKVTFLTPEGSKILLKALAIVKAVDTKFFQHLKNYKIFINTLKLLSVFQG